jgi:hypothetical protein
MREFFRILFRHDLIIIQFRFAASYFTGFALIYFHIGICTEIVPFIGGFVRK